MKRTILPLLVTAMLLIGGCARIPMTRFDCRNIKLDVGGRFIPAENVAVNVDFQPNVYLTMDQPIAQIVIEARIVEVDRGQQFREMGLWWPDLKKGPILPVHVVDTTPRIKPVSLNLGVGTVFGGQGRNDRANDRYNNDHQPSDSRGGVGTGIGVGTSIPGGGGNRDGVTALRATFDLPDLRVNLDEIYLYILMEVGREIDGRVIAQPMLLPMEVVKVPKAPEVKERQATTTVLVGDGNTVLLGGLFDGDAEKAKAKIPILGHIPLLNRLFRNKTKEDRKTELLIFVTPRIVMTNE